MNLDGSMLELIDLRSFSSLWFWIVLAVFWSSLTHTTLGVPFDVVVRARRKGGPFMDDLEQLVAIQIRRRGTILHSAGASIVLVWATLLTAIAVLGFGYNAELGQALTLLFLPATLVAGLRARLMMRLAQNSLRGEALCKALTWHRAGVQAIGLAAVLATTLWGMWFNLNVRALGG